MQGWSKRSWLQSAVSHFFIVFRQPEGLLVYTVGLGPKTRQAALAILAFRGLGESMTEVRL